MVTLVLEKMVPDPKKRRQPDLAESWRWPGSRLLFPKEVQPCHPGSAETSASVWSSCALP